jgi:hypothetical protein
MDMYLSLKEREILVSDYGKTSFMTSMNSETSLLLKPKVIKVK